jgi:hypothetical protein
MLALVPILGFSLVLVPGVVHLLERMNERKGSLLGLEGPAPTPDPSSTHAQRVSAR